jgi:hypothetical protein
MLPGKPPKYNPLGKRVLRSTKGQTYIPEIGLESLLFTLGSSRPLLATEYEQAFSNYPQLKEMFSKKSWPERVIETEEQERAASALESLQIVRTESDVNSVLSKFRKTVLGLEK